MLPPRGANVHTEVQYVKEYPVRLTISITLFSYLLSNVLRDGLVIHRVAGCPLAYIRRPPQSPAPHTPNTTHLKHCRHPCRPTSHHRAASPSPPSFSPSHPFPLASTLTAPYRSAVSLTCFLWAPESDLTGCLHVLRSCMLIIATFTHLHLIPCVLSPSSDTF